MEKLIAILEHDSSDHRIGIQLSSRGKSEQSTSSSLLCSTTTSEHPLEAFEGTFEYGPLHVVDRLVSSKQLFDEFARDLHKDCDTTRSVAQRE